MKNKHLLTYFFVVILINLQPVLALMNPASIYCTALGYNYSVEDGSCIFPDKSKADAWEFLLGKEKQEYSYCVREGYKLKIITDPEKCLVFLTKSCAGCSLPNGTVVEVTKLMGLSFEESKCGDGVCAFPENYKTCPQDCPSGSLDAYCDGVKDGICDKDCIYFDTPEKDPDCVECGNRKCEEPAENQTTCCLDCGCPEGLICKENQCIEQRCGNGICESFTPYEENYKTCPQDCPSGGKDNYCDAIMDGKCDPDCWKTNDIDCRELISVWVYVALFAVFTVLIGLLLVGIKRIRK